MVFDNSSGSETLTVVLDYVVHLRSLTEATLSFSARDLSLPAAPETELARDVYALIPADVTAESLGGTDFGAITSTLSDIDTASTLLLFLYGSPGEDLGAFAGSMQATPDFAGHSAESVRNRYGTVDSSTIADYLSAADVTAFQSLGLDNIVTAPHLQRSPSRFGRNWGWHVLTMGSAGETNRLRYFKSQF